LTQRGPSLKCLDESLVDKAQRLEECQWCYDALCYVNDIEYQS